MIDKTLDRHIRKQRIPKKSETKMEKLQLTLQKYKVMRLESTTCK